MNLSPALAAFSMCLLVQSSGGVPGNDDFSGRSVLGAGLPQNTGDINLAEASSEVLEPGGAGVSYFYSDAVSRSAWWTWTAAETGWVAIDLAGEPASVGVFEGETLDTLKERQITPALRPSRHSLFRAEAGHSYHLRLTGEGATRASLSAAPPETILHAPHDFSGPLPVESSRWGLAPIPKGELPEGAWGPGANGNDTAAGDWPCPHTGLFLATVQADEGYTAFEISAPIVTSGYDWTVFRGQAGAVYTVKSSRERSMRSLVTVRISAVTVDPPPAPSVSGNFPLAVERAFGDWAQQGSSFTMLWQPVEWVATESRACVVRGERGSTTFEAATEVTPGVWQRMPGQHISSDMRALYFNAVAGVRYRIRGMAEHHSLPWRAVLDWSSVPANDERTAATDAGTAEGVLFSATNRLATRNAEEASLFAGLNTDRVVWGRWTAPSTGERLMRSSLPSLITRVFAAASGGNAVEVPRTPVPGSPASFSFGAQAGTTYYFGFGAPAYSQVYEWTWSVSRAVPAAGTPRVETRLLGNRREAAERINFPQGLTRVVEWVWTAPCTSEFTVQSYSPKVEVLRRNETGDASPVAARDWLPLTQQIFAAQAGQTYLFRSAPSASTEYFIHLRPFSAVTHSSPGTAGDLRSEFPAHGLGLISPGEQCWWKWTAPVTGVISLGGGSSGVAVFDGQLNPIPSPALYTGAESMAAFQFLEVEKGKPYLFALSGTPGLAGVNLRRTMLTRPPNDDFAHAVDLGAERLIPWTGKGHGAVTAWERFSGSANVERDGLYLSSLEPGEPDYRPAPGETSVAGSLWWRWTAPRTERIRIQTTGAVRVFTGGGISILTAVPASRDADTEDGREGTAFQALAGTTYHIASLRDRYPSEMLSLLLFADVPGLLNDRYSDPVRVLATASPDVFSFDVPGMNFGTATREPEDPPAAADFPGSAPPATTWWRWRCPVTGFYRFFNGSYYGPNCGRIFRPEESAALAENPRSEAGDFAAVAGKDYTIVLYHRTDGVPEVSPVLERVTDHPYAIWNRLAAFNTEEQMLESACPAGDGITNAMKFFCGLNPAISAWGGHDPAAINLPRLVAEAGGGHSIRYRIDQSASHSVIFWNARVELQSSADLKNWTDVWPVTDDQSERGFNRIILPGPAGGGERYYRLKMRLTFDP